LPSPEDIARVLIEQLARQAGEETLAEAAQMYDSKFGRPGLINALRELIESAKIDYDQVTGYSTLAHLPFKLLITSNFDAVLEEVMDKTGVKPQVISESKNIGRIREDQLSVIKVHGDLNNVDIVITTEDHQNYSTRYREFYEWLGTIEQTKTIVYVGFDPEYRDFKWIDQRMRQGRTQYTHRDYVVTPRRVSKIVYAEWDRKGVEILSLPTAQFFERLTTKLNTTKFGVFIAGVNMLLLVK